MVYLVRMKTFEIILVNPETGIDSYIPTRISRRSFTELASELENLGVSFRCINDVTKNLPPGEIYNNTIPVEYLCA